MRNRRPIPHTLFAVLVLVLCTVGSVRAANSPDVRKLMTPEEFNAAGLETLSPAQIDALNRWLIRYTANEAPVQRRASPAVKEAMADVEISETRTRIVGDFNGWTGKTVFRLENGQVWQQRMDGRWQRRLKSPEVVISRNMLGFWMLRVVDGDRAIGVKRIQ